MSWMLLKTWSDDQEVSPAAAAAAGVAGPAGGYLGVQGLLYADPPLDAGLSSLDLGHDLLYVLQLVAALPEHGWQERDATIHTT